jgi:hypothetical protein
MGLAVRRESIGIALELRDQLLERTSGLRHGGEQLFPMLSRIVAAKSSTPDRRHGPANDNSPAVRAFARCAEEDSNVHPVIPDQVLAGSPDLARIARP